MAQKEVNCLRGKKMSIQCIRLIINDEVFDKRVEMLFPSKLFSGIKNSRMYR